MRLVRTSVRQSWLESARAGVPFVESNQHREALSSKHIWPAPSKLHLHVGQTPRWSHLTALRALTPCSTKLAFRLRHDCELYVDVYHSLCSTRTRTPLCVCVCVLSRTHAPVAHCVYLVHHHTLPSLSCGVNRRCRPSGFHSGYSRDSRMMTIDNGRKSIAQLAASLSLQTHHIDSAHR